MAKRKKRKEEKKGFQYWDLIISFILILLSIVGLGTFGLVGGFIKNFAVFMFGSWFFLFLGFTLFIGVSVIYKRTRSESYMTPRMIGLYSIILAILLFSHIKYISTNDLEASAILRTTLDNIVLAFKDSNAIANTGGGMIGGFFAWAFVSMFDVEGTIVVMGAITLFGIIMIFDITPANVFHSVVEAFKGLFRSDSEDEEEKEENNNKVVGGDDIENKKVVITSLDDLDREVKQQIETNQVAHEEKPLNIEEPTNETTVYRKPSIELLDPIKKTAKENTTEIINNNISTLERVFNDFGMRAKVVEVHEGPAVTQYEMNLERGTKVSKVLSISREIALALAAKEVRIEAPIPGKNTVGVEIPNKTIKPVSMREIMDAMSRNTKLADSKLAAPLGRDIMGNVKYVEINKTPHMLVAGATGSGKSVCINNIILSILMRTTPDEVKMVLVDPKKVEFNVYDGIPHLLTPVVTDPKKASEALQKIVVMMDDRYETFKNSGTKNIQTYNEYIEKELKKKPDCGLKKMPFILVIIDELADLMLVAAKEVEESIMRITQLARAAGIHLIVATQRPSTDVITGVVKSNIPTRVSFAVSSSIDSRTILDMTGSEKLLGKGDMLYKPMDDNAPTRIQGSFVSDGEIARVVKFVKDNSSTVKYSEEFNNIKAKSAKPGSDVGDDDGGGEKDVLYDEILNYAIRTGQISASLIQRKYSIGYNRAARIIDQFEERGIVGPAKGSKPRDVLVQLENNGEE